jgi:8-oxo-dGTP pyrophosphatase MutT (NUDIX family)
MTSFGVACGANAERDWEGIDLKDRIRTRLAGRARKKIEDPGLVRAAVLVPLLCKEGEWHVVVTLRTQSVEHHKGQMSFPGGACDSKDADAKATALRETYEEIGVRPEAVEVLGALDDFQTITSFVVTPFVGVIPHPFPYRLNSDEVEAVVEVPLAFLRDPAHLRVESLEYEGRMFEVLFWDYGSDPDTTYTIWGATARILKDFLDRDIGPVNGARGTKDAEG